MTRVPVQITFAVLLAAAVAHAQTASRISAIAPVLDEQTLAVGRLDLRKVDMPAVVKLLAEIAPDKSLAMADQLRQIEDAGAKAIHLLTQAGLSDVYVVVSLSDSPPNPPFLAAPVKPGQPPEAAAKALQEFSQLPAADSRPGLAIAGSQATIDRLKKLQPAARPEFAAGFERAPETAAQLVVAPSEDVRRVLREMLPRLPDEIGGGSGKLLADVRWATLSANLPPKLDLNLSVQANGPDAAVALRGLAVSGLQLVSRQEQVRREFPQIDELARLLTPQIKGDRLTLELTAENGGAEKAIALLARPLQAVRTAAGRAQSANNLKQIMLAMHNYHDTYGAFPPQAIRSKDGKPQLSWRVALLPFFDASPLYKEFHLDEPWDSEHNKKLIEKMPAVLASPHLGDAVRAKGMTSYLAPLSKRPPAVFIPPQPSTEQTRESDAAPDEQSKDPQMVFDVARGTRMRLITDGTSNTIGVVEAHPKHAVIWTKPDDLVIDPKDPAAALRGQPNDGFNAGLCDGSVRFLKATLDAKTLMRLFQMDDGEPIGEF